MNAPDKRMEGGGEQKADAQRRIDSERAIDETSAESFPASDPPSWVPLTGVRAPDPVR